MCGIGGANYIIRKQQSSKILTSLASRGPDGSGELKIDDKVYFLHTRLAIQDLTDAASQPMVSDCRRYMLTYNGEIYNAVHLKERYLSDVECFSTSDTEILLKLLVRYGMDILPKLRGIFAFAFYDLDASKLFLCRDAFGVKPLFYELIKDKLHFASTVDAVLLFNASQKELDATVLARHMSFIWSPGADTLAKSIKSLSPGSYLEVCLSDTEPLSLTNTQWYKLPEMSSSNKKIRKDRKYYFDGLKANLYQAVERQLISDVPVGAFLSGGLDSSAIVSIACELGYRLPCYTIAYPNNNTDGFIEDLPYAKKVSQELNVDLNIISIDPATFCSELESSIMYLGHPIADPAVINTNKIAKAARSDGNLVLFSGTGGDDILTGYRRHVALHYANMLPFRSSDLYKKLEEKLSLLNNRVPLFRRLQKFLRSINLEHDQMVIELFRWLRHDDVKNLLIDHIDDQVLTAPFVEILAECGDLSLLEKCLVLEQKFFLTDHNLIYTDRMTMAHGVEARVPFLDEDLVAFCATIPAEYKIKNGTTKLIFKKIMEELLPNDVIYRKKTGFGLPIREWIINEFHELKEKYLYSDVEDHYGIFQMDKVRALDKENTKGNVDASYTLFSILCIQIWLSQRKEYFQK